MGGWADAAAIATVWCVWKKLMTSKVASLNMDGYDFRSCLYMCVTWAQCTTAKKNRCEGYWGRKKKVRTESMTLTCGVQREASWINTCRLPSW